jgi:FemAB-related protein (PEP-CTERM system-associated)
MNTALKGVVAGSPAAPRVDLFDGPASEWDAVVRRSSGTSHHHLYAWRSVMKDVFGHDTPYLAARADGALTGVLPLVRVKSALFGHYLVSMPFLNYGGPVGEPDAVRALSAEAARMADRDGARLLELRAREEHPVDLPVSHRKITVVLDIPPEGSDALFKKLPAKLRSQVRRPAKEGITYRFGPAEVDSFFDVFARHMRDLGTPALPRSFFVKLAALFAESAWFGCAYLGDIPVACGCGFRWGNEFEMTWASSLREHNRTAANMGLYWTFMERAAQDGAREFNFGRCTPGGGTHRFKQQWGGKDVPLWWYQHAGKAAGDNPATPSPDQGAYALGPKLWRYLPVPIANLIGPQIVRLIP